MQGCGLIRVCGSCKAKLLKKQTFLHIDLTRILKMTILKRWKFSRTQLQSMTHTMLKEICKGRRRHCNESYVKNFSKPRLAKSNTHKSSITKSDTTARTIKKTTKLKIKNLRSGTLGLWPRGGGVGPRGFKNC